jgi:ADP-heptose:LPS heptosyltransferase
MNVLIVRPDGIGDEILSLPVASALRSQSSTARIHFLSSEPAAPLLAHHPDLDGIITLPRRAPFQNLVTVFRKGFDAAVFLKPYPRLMLAAFVARVPLRVATGCRWYSFLANRRVYQHRSDFAKHESRYNLDLLTGLGLDPAPFVAPRLVLTMGERQQAEQRLAGLPTPRVVIHPGGLTARHWRARHYFDLAVGLAESGCGVVLTGTKDEQDRFLAEVGGESRFRGSALDLRGALNLREFMAVIAVSQAVVSGSTGAAHVGAGFGVPTVSLYDPQRKTSPTRWGPLGGGVVLQPDVPTCEACVFQACPYWDCLDRITVEAVAGRVRSVVGHPEPTMQVVHV